MPVTYDVIRIRDELMKISLAGGKVYFTYYDSLWLIDLLNSLIYWRNELGQK